MNEIAIEELTKIKIEEHFNNKKETKRKYYKISKIQLIDFCISLVKIIKEVEES